MSRGCTAVLDVGRTNTRLVLVAEGQPLECATRRTAFRSGPPYPHVDDRELFAWLCEALREAAAAHDVEAIVPVAHGAAVALVGARELVLPILDYEVEDLPPLELAPDAFEETFSPELPGGLNVARQLAWQQAHFPGEFAQTRTILMYPQFWTWKLTGRAVSEVTSLGCHTHLWAPRERTFSRLAKDRGWDRLYPPLADAWAVVGGPTAEVRERTGLRADCRVHAGIHDSNAAFLAHRIGREGPFSVVSTGTWVVCMASGADLARLSPGRDMLANVDAFGEPVACMRFAGGREYAKLAGGGGGEGSAATPGPEDVARIVREGILALPCFSESGGPFAGRRGVIVPKVPAEPVLRAALACLYSALMIDYALDALGARGEIVVEGPMAKSEPLVSVLAALRPEQAVHASDDPTGSVRGAARLAAWDEEASTRPLAPRLVRVGQEIDGLLDYRARWRGSLAT